jgi:toluene monooxygenase system protein D
MATNSGRDGYLNNRVGPILRPSDLTEGIIEAAVEDNPGKDIRVDDKVGYVRIDTEGEMIIRRATLERTLGRPFKMVDLEVNLGSFAGRIETTAEYVRFFYNKNV